MIAVTVIAVGRVKDRNILRLLDDYAKRLSPYIRLRLFEVPAQSFSRATIKAAQAKEEEDIRKYLERQEGRKIFLLTEAGRQLESSQEFSQLIDGIEETVFVIGGASGFSASFKNSHPCLSLSPLTFTHEMARLILFEQLYRGACLAIGKDYHY